VLPSEAWHNMTTYIKVLSFIHAPSSTDNMKARFDRIYSRAQMNDFTRLSLCVLSKSHKMLFLQVGS
jgi:hypothetical protein